jgi:hypothetical protein
MEEDPLAPLNATSVVKVCARPQDITNPIRQRALFAKHRVISGPFRICAVFPKAEVPYPPSTQDKPVLRQTGER